MPTKLQVLLERRIHADDGNGNSNTTTFDVTLLDVTDPVAIAQNVTVQLDASGNGSTTAALVNNSSTDNCGIDTMALDISTFDCTNIGPNTVTLTVTDVNGNVSAGTTATVIVEKGSASCSNIPAERIPLNIAVYPNPSKGVFNLTFQNKDTDTNIFLFDFSGRLIEQKSITSGSRSASQEDILIGNNTLSSGLYIIKIISGDKTIIKKVMVE
jgi:PKD repeat protein